MRTEEHKLIVYPQIGKSQLFDLKNDPQETRDRAEERGYAAVRGRLKELLKKHRRELADPLAV